MKFFGYLMKLFSFAGLVVSVLAHEATDWWRMPVIASLAALLSVAADVYRIAERKP